MTRKKQDKNTEPVVIEPFDFDDLSNNALKTPGIKPEEEIQDDA